jgi:polar amino acid transport system substrate-binding protein
MLRLMRVAPILLLPCLLLLLADCGGPQATTDLWRSSTLYRAKQRGRLVVALEPEFRPFEYVDEKSAELVGFDVDLARILGREMKVEVEFLRVKWESIIASLLTGKADLIISGMTATPERALKVSYSDPYFSTVTCLLVSNRKAPDVKGIADLDHEGRVVVVKQGTTGDVAAHKRCPHARIVSYPTENAAALEVAQGRADAFLYDLRSIENHHAKHPDTTRVVRTPVSIEPYAIACRKGDPDTVAWLNLVLQHLRRDGRLKELHAKYGLENAEAQR